MAMTPAEQSRPGRKWSGHGAPTWIQDPFWSVVVILFFVLGLYLTAGSALTVSRTMVSDEHHSTMDVLLPFGECFAGIVIVSGLLLLFGANPRTRSEAASVSYKAMMALMFLAGIVLFLGGALQMIKTTDFVEQIALASVSLFFTVTPLSLQFIRR